jgi:hypothetical protein
MAAKRALEAGNVNFLLPWVSEGDEAEIRAAFDNATAARAAAPTSAASIVDLWFFETAVRLHRKGENAPYTGLRPSGLDEGPIIPMAEKALETGNADELTQLLADSVKEEIQQKFEAAIAWQGYDVNDVKAGRKYVRNMLEFIFYAQHLCEFVKGCKAGTEQSQTEVPDAKRRSEIIKSAAALGHHHVKASV